MSQPRKGCAIAVYALVFMSPASPQDRSQARSMVITRRGIVATSQTLASQAGAMILAQGGNAIDAAIAANATLGVVEPMMNGIGGDLFVIYREARSGKIHGLNASGYAPKLLTSEFLHKAGAHGMPQDGIHSVTVPGCVEGWAKLHKRFGRAAWAALFKPALYYAKNGFPVTELISGSWAMGRGKLAADDNARRVYLDKDGNAPSAGEIFRNPELARALELIAAQGAAAFYRGPIAEAILKTSRRHGGVMAAADLAEFQSEWVEAISTTYRGWRVFELPPNGQGMAALSMLNLFERFPIGDWGPSSLDAWHHKIEAQKLAYADLNRYLADPRFHPVPVRELISKPYAEKRAALILPEQAQCSREAGNISTSGDTIYLSVTDKDGNVVSLIQSIYQSFGSGVVVDDYGFHLHNRGALFTLEEGHANELKPRKRPFHTIIPGYMEKDNLHIGFGIMGGFNQAQAHAQFVSNVADHGMNIQAALEAPRFTKLNFSGCDVMIEARVPEETQNGLRRKGHILQVLGDFSSSMGGGQAVIYDSKAGVNYGASSPRKDGAAIPEPDPYINMMK